MKKPGGAKVAAPSGTVTFLFSDIEESTQRWDRDRAAMQEALRVHDRHMRAAIASHDGYVFKTIGDAFCAEFTTPESATCAALAAQRALETTDFSAGSDHRSVAITLTGLANLRARQSRLAESEALYERALSIYERSSGPDYVLVTDALVGLASLRKEQGRTADAITL
jgi:class 3 adenylate cyclase